MNEEVIFNRLKTILTENTSITVEVTPETALLGQQVLDSMDFMNYLVSIEHAYQIAIPEEDIAARQLGIVGNMVAYISEKTA